MVNQIVHPRGVVWLIPLRVTVDCWVQSPTLTHSLPSARALSKHPGREQELWLVAFWVFCFFFTTSAVNYPVTSLVQISSCHISHQPDILPVSRLRAQSHSECRGQMANYRQLSPINCGCPQIGLSSFTRPVTLCKRGPQVVPGSAHLPMFSYV